jgi:hypothetical protein
MKHKHYEKTILSGSTSEYAEKQALHQHLCECDFCYELTRNWRKAESVLQNAPILTPDPGFSIRWQNRLADDRVRHDRRQSLLVLTASGIGAFFFLILFILLWSQALEVGLVQAGWFGKAVVWVRTVNQVVVESTPIHFHFPDMFPILIVMGMFAFIGAIGTLWLKLFRILVKYQRLATQI